MNQKPHVLSLEYAVNNIDIAVRYLKRGFFLSNHGVTYFMDSIGNFCYFMYVIKGKSTKITYYHMNISDALKVIHDFMDNKTQYEIDVMLQNLAINSLAELTDIELAEYRYSRYSELIGTDKNLPDF